MKDKEIYTGNISIAFVLFLGYYFFQSLPLFYIGMSMLFLSLISETSAKFIAIVFKKIFALMGGINSRIILTLFYFGILLPTSLLKSLFTKKTETNKHTKWINLVDKKYNFKELW